MKSRRAMTLTELVLTVCISTIVLGVAIATITALLNSYRINMDSLSDGLNARAANAHLFKHVREASYAKVQNENGVDVDHGSRLELYDYEGNLTGRYSKGGPAAGNRDLLFEDFIVSAGVETERFDNVRVNFRRMSETAAGEVKEVQVDFIRPFDSVTYLNCRVDINPSDTWAMLFNNGGSDEPWYVGQVPDGGYIIAGLATAVPSIGIPNSFFVLKIGKTGSYQWSKTFHYGTINGSFAWCANKTSDGGCIVAGTDEGKGFVVKTDANGNNQWSRRVETPSPWKSAWFFCVQETSDTGYIIAGRTDIFSGPGEYDIFVIKLDRDGNNEWSTSIGGGHYDLAASVQETFDTDGTSTGYILCGYTYSFGNVDAYLVKIDVNGNNEWSRTFGGGNSDCSWCVRQTSDGGYVMTGETASFGGGYDDVYLVKTDADGNHEWSKTFGGSDYEFGLKIAETRDGGYIIAGMTCSFGAGNSDFYLLKTGPSGNLEWTKTFGQATWDETLHVQETLDPDGNPTGYILVGYIYSFESENDDILAIKTDLQGNCPEADNIGELEPVNTYDPPNGVPIEHISTAAPPTGTPTLVIDTSGVPSAPPNPPTGTPTTDIDTSGVPSAPPNPPTGTPAVHDPGMPS